LPTHTCYVELFSGAAWVLFGKPRFQTSISDGGHGNRLIGALETLKERIAPVHNRLKTVIIENLDWRVCLDRYDRPNTVMYIDPPYPDNGTNYFHNMRDWKEHRELAERLRKTECKWILSSYDIPEMRELYPENYVVAVQMASGMKARKNGSERVINKEVLITNFLPDSAAVSYFKDQEVRQMRMVLEKDEPYKA